MTDTTTEAVNALLDGVTAGPWQITGQPDKICVADSYTKNGAAKTIATVNTPTWMGATEPYANARFIAAARQLVPALLAERDTAIARAEQAEAALNLERAIAGAMGVAAVKAALDMAAAAVQAEVDAAHKDADDAQKRGLGVASFNVRQYATAMESVIPSIRAITVGDVLAKVGAK